MTITTTAANPFDVQCNARELTYSVIDTRSGALMRCFFVEDGAAGMQALNCADALWYAELTAAPEVAPEPQMNAARRFVQSKCDRCGKATPASQNGIGDLFTLPEEFGDPLRGEGDFCAACCARYDAADWLMWLQKHRPSIFVLSAPLPSYTLIPGSADSPAALLNAALNHQNAVNHGRQWLLSWRECPQLWASVWADLGSDERDEVLAGARLAGATPCELNALAGLSYAPGQDAVGKPTFASLLVR